MQGNKGANSRSGPKPDWVELHGHSDVNSKVYIISEKSNHFIQNNAVIFKF